jgi:hypothetical protein
MLGFYTVKVEVDNGVVQTPELTLRNKERRSVKFTDSDELGSVIKRPLRSSFEYL